MWSNRATDYAFTKGAVGLRCKPRVTQRGGRTKDRPGLVEAAREGTYDVPAQMRPPAYRVSGEIFAARAFGLRMA